MEGKSQCGAKQLVRFVQDRFRRGRITCALCSHLLQLSSKSVISFWINNALASVNYPCFTWLECLTVNLKVGSLKLNTKDLLSLLGYGWKSKGLNWISNSKLALINGLHLQYLLRQWRVFYSCIFSLWGFSHQHAFSRKFWHKAMSLSSWPRT